MNFFIKLIKKLQIFFYLRIFLKKNDFLLVNCILNNYFIMELGEMFKLNKNMYITNECIKINNFSHMFKVHVNV